MKKNINLLLVVMLLLLITVCSKEKNTYMQYNLNEKDINSYTL